MKQTIHRWTGRMVRRKSPSSFISPAIRLLSPVSQISLSCHDIPVTLQLIYEKPYCALPWRARASASPTVSFPLEASRAATSKLTRSVRYVAAQSRRHVNFLKLFFVRFRLEFLREQDAQRPSAAFRCRGSSSLSFPLFLLAHCKILNI